MLHLGRCAVLNRCPILSLPTQCRLLPLLHAGRGVLPALSGVAQPKEFAGARVVEAPSFPMLNYSYVHVSMGLSPTVYHELCSFHPDIVHATSPGPLACAAGIYAQ